MSREVYGTRPANAEQAFGTLRGLLDSVGILQTKGFDTDVSMPYAGDPALPDGYVIVGPEGSKSDHNVRGTFCHVHLGEDRHGFWVSRFYVPGGKALETVGMPRFRNEGADHRLENAPRRIRGFGVWLDLGEQAVGVAARSEDGILYREEFGASQCHFPDHTPTGEADIAYRIGAVAAVVATRKYSTVQ